MTQNPVISMLGSDQTPNDILPDRTPPHTCRPLWIDRVFEAIKGLNTAQITREFITANVVGSGHQGKVLGALRFLGLIDEEGNVTSRLRALRVVGPEFSTNLTSVVQLAYSDLLRTVAVKSASFDRLINFLMQKYSMSQPQAEGAAHLFIHLASLSGMELSEELSKAPVAKPEPPVKKAIPTKAVARKQDPASDNGKYQKGSPVATIDGPFGQIRIVDQPTLELARKLLDMIETQLKLGESKQPAVDNSRSFDR